MTLHSDLLSRLEAPDYHDPKCPFKKHCYCDDGAPHDRVSHPDGPEAAQALKQQALEIKGLREERDALIHDLERSMDTANNYVNECERLRELLAKTQDTIRDAVNGCEPRFGDLWRKIDAALGKAE